MKGFQYTIFQPNIHNSQLYVGLNAFLFVRWENLTVYSILGLCLKTPQTVSFSI